MSVRLRAYKTKLRLNNAERQWCMRCAGTARWCYNWGLAEWQRQYEAGKKPSAYALKKQLNASKDDLAPWLRETPYTILQAAFDNLGAAYQNFFRRGKAGERPRHLHFKSRKHPRQAFSVRGNISITETTIKLPRVGCLRLAEHGYLPTAKSARVLSATVSTQDHGATWYVSVQVKEDVAEPEPATSEPIGIDLGIKALAVLSDGTVYENKRPFRKVERKIARLNRELARRHKGGSNWSKTKAKLNRAHATARRVRQHHLHQISAETVAKRPSVIVMEDLNVRGMSNKRGHLGKSVGDAGMGELRRQMEYKAAWNGCAFVLADQWEPSSKRCSACGAIKPDLARSDRTYVCTECGLVLDRDLNAARNLVALAYQPA